MESQSAETGLPYRQSVLAQLERDLAPFESTSHLVFLDSVTRTPQELANGRRLDQLSLAGPTDTAADLPAMLEAARRWIVETRAGNTELWIVSDLQQSNWQPDDTRWASVAGQLAALPQKVRARLYAPAIFPIANATVRVQGAVCRSGPAGQQLSLTLDLERIGTNAATVPLAVTIDGTTTQLDVAWEGQALRLRQNLPLPPGRTNGWGRVELPADANLRDNTAYFVYGPEPVGRAVVVAPEESTGRLLGIAAATLSSARRQPASRLTADRIQAGLQDDVSLVVWQAPLPGGPIAERLQAFVRTGGVLFFFPPGAADPGRFLQCGWSEVQTAPAEATFRIARWDQDQGPLARTDEGLSLAVGDLAVTRRQAPSGSLSVLAGHADGAPFLGRLSSGNGSVYFCSTLPQESWSSLGDGPVLVPMLQRALQAGAIARIAPPSAVCGELSAGDAQGSWLALDRAAPKPIRSEAGVFRPGERLLAVNRPETEDDPQRLGPADASKLLGTVPTLMAQGGAAPRAFEHGEIWRPLLALMLLALLAEAALIVPPPRPAAETGAPSAAPRREPARATP
jgi:hypothetical protein